MKAAHVHVISALLGELDGLDREGALPSDEPVRTLDVGCGYGGLMADLLGATGGRFRGRPLEVYGYEVTEHRGSTPGFAAKAIEGLSEAFPRTPWAERLRVASAAEPWPFPDGFFAAAVSNQVLEHVERIEPFFCELRRVLRGGGAALHFYPPAEALVEPHSGAPMAHWRGAGARNLKGWLRGCSRLGLSKFPRYRRERGSSLEAFCEEFCDYLTRYVFFRSNRSLRRAGAEGFAACGFKYDWELARRAVADDWEPFAYAGAHRWSRSSWLAPFGCSTLVQRTRRPESAGSAARVPA